MKLLSQERLDSLLEQRDYLKKLYAFHYKDFLRYSDAHYNLLQSWEKAGLVETTSRIELEIAFLEDFLS